MGGRCAREQCENRLSKLNGQLPAPHSAALGCMLQSPRFLYRVELCTAEKVGTTAVSSLCTRSPYVSRMSSGTVRPMQRWSLLPKPVSSRPRTSHRPLPDHRRQPTGQRERQHGSERRRRRLQRRDRARPEARQQRGRPLPAVSSACSRRTGTIASEFFPKVASGTALAAANMGQIIAPLEEPARPVRTRRERPQHGQRV